MVVFRKEGIDEPLHIIPMVVAETTVYHVASGGRQLYVLSEGQSCRTSIGRARTMFYEVFCQDCLAFFCFSAGGALVADFKILSFGPKTNKNVDDH